MAHGRSNNFHPFSKATSTTLRKSKSGKGSGLAQGSTIKSIILPSTQFKIPSNSLSYDLNFQLDTSDSDDLESIGSNHTSRPQPTRNIYNGRIVTHGSPKTCGTENICQGIGNRNSFKGQTPQDINHLTNNFSKPNNNGDRGGSPRSGGIVGELKKTPQENNHQNPHSKINTHKVTMNKRAQGGAPRHVIQCGSNNIYRSFEPPYPSIKNTLKDSPQVQNNNHNRDNHLNNNNYINHISFDERDDGDDGGPPTTKNNKKTHSYGQIQHTLNQEQNTLNQNTSKGQEFSIVDGNGGGYCNRYKYDYQESNYPNVYKSRGGYEGDHIGGYEGWYGGNYNSNNPNNTNNNMERRRRLRTQINHGSSRHNIKGNTSNNSCHSSRQSYHSRHRSQEGSIHGSEHGSIHGSKHGSIHGSKHGSIHGSKHGSIDGSNHGSIDGSKHGSIHGSKHGSLHKSKHGSLHGSKHGSQEGSIHGSHHGSREESIPKSHHGGQEENILRSQHHSREGSVHGSHQSQSISNRSHTTSISDLSSISLNKPYPANWRCFGRRPPAILEFRPLGVERIANVRPAGKPSFLVCQADENVKRHGVYHMGNDGHDKIKKKSDVWDVCYGLAKPITDHWSTPLPYATGLVRAGDIDPYFRPARGDLVIINPAQNFYRAMQTGYVMTYRGQRNYSFGVGDLIVRLGKFMPSKRYIPYGNLELYMHTQTREKRFLGRQPFLLVDFNYHNLDYESPGKHVAIGTFLNETFFPRRGDIVIRGGAWAENYPNLHRKYHSSIKYWRPRMQFFPNDMLLRPYVDMGRSSSRNEFYYGAAELYSYSGKGLAWAYWGRDHHICDTPYPREQEHGIKVGHHKDEVGHFSDR